MNTDDIQAEVEIFTESTIAEGGFQIAIGGGDHPHIDLHPFVAAHAANFFFLQHAQQLGLHLGGQLANLIQEDGAAIGCLKQAFVALDGPGKSAFLIPEELALNERGDQGAAIHGHERPAGQRAAKVNGARHQFFAGAAFAGDQHRRAGVL